MALRTLFSCSFLLSALFVYLLSCNNSVDSDGVLTVKQTLTAQEKADLINIARSVDSLPLSFSYKRTAMRKRSIQGCETITTGFEVCIVETDEVTLLDSSHYYLDADNTTPVDPSTVKAGTYLYTKSHMLLRNDRKKCDFYQDIAFKRILPDSNSVDEKSRMDYVITARGTINYYQNDLLLEFSEVTTKGHNSIWSIDYRFTLVDGKYSVRLSYTRDYNDQSVAWAVEGEEMIQGPIVNKNNEQIGVFILKWGQSVDIFDNNGILVEDAEDI
jgi:hypothetical protein